MKTKTDFDSQPLTAAFAKFSHDREILRSLSSGISNKNKKLNLRRFEYLVVSFYLERAAWPQELSKLVNSHCKLTRGRRARHPDQVARDLVFCQIALIRRVFENLDSAIEPFNCRPLV